MKKARMLNGVGMGCVLVSGLLAGNAMAEEPYEVEWAQWLTGDSWVSSASVAVDGMGNPYITGKSYSSDLPGPNSSGSIGGFLAKYSSGGDSLWVQPLQFSSSLNEGHAIAFDASDNLYVGGSTGRDSSTHAFLARYDTSSGSLLWGREIGENADFHGDTSRSVTTDVAGNVYVAGGTSGGPVGSSGSNFLAKYDSDGSVLWDRQFGPSGYSVGRSVAADAGGNTYLSGHKWSGQGNDRRRDAFFSKYDINGNALWTHDFDYSSGSRGYSVTVDTAGNSYVTGSIGGLDSTDMFLAKYDTGGNVLWTQEIDMLGHVQSEFDVADVVVDDAGNVYVGRGSVPPYSDDISGGEAFIVKYSTDGIRLWEKVLVLTESEAPNSIHSMALDETGNLYVSGFSYGSDATGMPGAYLVKLSVPEPGTLAGVGVLIGLFGLRRRQLA